MEDLETQVTGEQPVVQPEVSQEAPQGKEVETKEQAFDITKDARWEKDWKKDINNVYKALKGYDKTYTPLQMAIKKYGINDPQTLEKTLEEYKSLKSPENDLNKFISYLNPVLTSEEDRKWFQETVEKKLQEIKFRGLDQNLPPEYKEAILKGQEADKRVKELEQKLEIREIQEKITSSLKEIESYSTENNLEFDKNEFLKYCQEKNVPSHLMMDVFQAKAKPFIINNETRKAEENLLKNQEANRKGGIKVGNKGIAPASGKENFMSGLDKILGLNK